VNSSFFGEPWPGLTDAVGAFLDRARERTGALLWFDTCDSTGTTQFETLPFVDLYCKSQVLARRSDYLRDYGGQRVFVDYFESHYGVARARRPGTPAVPRREDLSRIVCSWNCGLGDHGPRDKAWRLGRRIRVWRHGYGGRFVRARKRRSGNVVCRLGTSHLEGGLRRHREEIRTILEAGFGTSTARVSRRLYLRELREASISVSPFGHGEICLRDFETFLAGAALVKPDMSHIETWPPFYLDGMTYAAHRWDLADLHATLQELLSSKRRKAVASCAQDLYHRYLVERSGHEEFCRRFAMLVEHGKRVVGARPGEDQPSMTLAGA
jgi:hypothetical protein